MKQKKNKNIIVLPAYNAEKTLEITHSEIPQDIIDEIVIVDDNSTDQTVKVAKKLGIKHIIQHQINLGYGGNQKSCYDKALSLGADIVIMLHPDYQYTPKLIPAIVAILNSGLYDVVLGSRILGKGALEGGMPRYKYIANRFLTLFQNFIMKEKLSEYHTGYRAFTREVLESIDYKENSNDFVFDNQMLAQIFNKGFKISEISCPTKYFPDASSINLRRSIQYGLGVLTVSIQYFLHRNGIKKYNYLR